MTIIVTPTQASNAVSNYLGVSNRAVINPCLWDQPTLNTAVSTIVTWINGTLIPSFASLNLGTFDTNGATAQDRQQLLVAILTLVFGV